MEEDKKKRKNKKKKNKQTKAADDVSDGVGATTSLEHNHVDSKEHNNGNQISGDVTVQTAGLAETNVQLDRDQHDGLVRASLDEKIKQLQSENDTFIQREAGLDKKIKQLQSENDSFIQREVDLEKKIMNLQNEKDSWLQKEASLESKVEELSDENASYTLKTNSMRERIDTLNQDKIRLQEQVKELEESRARLVQEKQHLMETISSLQSQIQQHELKRETSFSASSNIKMTKHVSEHEDLKAQIEAGHVLVEKLIAENAQLVVKVNELYIELDRQSIRPAHSSTAGFDRAVVSEIGTIAENVSEFSDKISASGERMESFETIQMGDRISSTNNADTGISDITAIQITDYPASYEAGESEEIVQVPLDDGEIQGKETPATSEAEENVPLPLSDAPLIGAPFRLISFVAKYVSGADLVDKNTSTSSR